MQLLAEPTAMARALRFDFPDTLHHVTNRGLERRDIVRDDVDRSEFVRLLGRVATRYDWRVFAWVLMTNHFHLFFRIPTASLSSGMHDLESGYATLFNRRHERCGPLFQGRFHDVVVENETHCLALSRYIHLNPCRAGLAARPEAWWSSSYREFLDPQLAAPWLDWPTVLGELSQRESAARVAYKRFVEAGLDSSLPNPLDAAVDGWILGNEAFVERVRKSCLSEDGRAKLQTPEQVVELAAQCFGQAPSVALSRGRHANLAREAAILLCRELLAVPAGRIAQVFGVSPSGLSTAVQRARQRAEAEPEFASLVAKVRESLGRGHVF